MEVTEPFIIIKRGKYIFKRQHQRYLPIRNGKYFQKITQNLKSNIMDWKLDGEIIPKSEFSERDYEWAGFKWRNQSLHLHDIFRVAHSNESNFSPENWDFIFFIEPVCFWGPGSLHLECLWNLTDVSLAAEETKSILTDDANKTIPGNMAM